MKLSTKERVHLAVCLFMMLGCAEVQLSNALRLCHEELVTPACVERQGLTCCIWRGAKGRAALECDSIENTPPKKQEI